jgi:hypothetical protein
MSISDENSFFCANAVTALIATWEMGMSGLMADVWNADLDLRI